VCASAHEEHRAELAALAGDEAPLAAVAQLSEGWAHAARAGRCRRRYGRFSPGAAPFVTLVLEAVGRPGHVVRVEAFREPPPFPRRLEWPVGRGTMWLVALPFADDPGLPALPAVLADCDAYRVVRYRPHQRCTLDAVVGGQARYAKVLAGGSAPAVHRAGMELWDASRRGELGFRVAAPDRLDAPAGTVWQHALPGAGVKERLLTAEGPALAERMGAALASLALSRARPAAVLDRRAAFGRTLRVARDLAAHVPALGARVDALLAEIQRLHDAAPPRPLRPVHGAPHPPQWLDAAGELALVDFDRFALGERERDVAVFQAEMDYERRAPVDAVNAAFLGGYEAVAGPLDRTLLAAHRAAGGLAKAARSARAVRPDGDERAARHLQRAWAAIEQYDGGRRARRG
jgi:hypothetical protein